jgi:PAS domain S-box-containing protein
MRPRVDLENAVALHKLTENRQPRPPYVPEERMGNDVSKKFAGTENFFGAVFERAAVGIAVADRDGRFVAANPRLCEILGYTADELCETTFLAITHAEDLARTRSQFERLLAGEIPKYAFEKRYVRKDGSAIWIYTTVTTLRDNSGEPRHMVGVIQELGERRLADEARNRLAAVVESSDDAIISKTLDGVITSWNRGAERIFGHLANEAIGKPITILIPPDHLGEEPAILERMRRGERIDHYETMRLRKDGSLLNVSLSVSPIRDGSGTIIGASKIARDITEQKRIEREAAGHARILEQLNSALRETDRRKDEFLATLAHELRNPLAPIRQAALIAQAPGATDTQKRWSHDVISRQVAHMSLLLDDLLDVSRITRGSLELRIATTDLATVVDAAVETARPSIDAKGHTLAIELPGQSFRFAADTLRLAQVLANLLTNAAKYTDPGGTIRVRGARVAERIVISVADNGIGIPADALDEVFRMFSQVKTAQDRSDGGLGIGLALSKGIVELHGGTITVTSAGSGQGSEFTVELPVRGAVVARREDASISRKDPATRRRVLIADDNRDAAESLAILLRMDGHDVNVVHDGHAAIAAFDALRPEVILLDIGMPRLDGYEVARQMRERARQKVTLVAITGWGQHGDKTRALAAGFDHHFTKPIEPEDIAALLRSG